MEIVGFNEANSEKYFLFYLKENKKRLYYRIGNDELRAILFLDQMSSKEIEETEEFKNIDGKTIVDKSILYAEYDGNKHWKYYMQQFIVPYIIFEGYSASDFPPHVYRSGIGFTNGFMNIFVSGINAFLGKDNALCIEEFYIKKNADTSIRKIPNKGYKLILGENDFEELFTAVGIGKQFGNRMSQNAVSEFFHKKFPDKSQYKEENRGKELKRILISAMDESVVGLLTKEELIKVENFYDKILGITGNKHNFLQRNFLKVSECNLENILKEFEKHLANNPSEQTWQTFFEKNIFIFDSRYTNFISKQSIKPGRRSEPDFLVYDIYGYIDIYEIKKSNVSLLQYDKSHDNYYWSPDVSRALSQLENYIFDCSQNRLSIESSLKEEKGLDLKIIRPKGVLVIGSRSNFENNDRMEKDFEVLRSSLKNIEIVLYDEMYDRLKNLKVSSLRPEEK
ncbi:MAG: DUF4263 domain-containing protein [Lachnospiraceae bacterium]|nr:DUF4263 domain-containing protein [Lachnospiraceae bacterium]